MFRVSDWSRFTVCFGRSCDSRLPCVAPPDAGNQSCTTSGRGYEPWRLEQADDGLEQTLDLDADRRHDRDCGNRDQGRENRVLDRGLPVLLPEKAHEPVLPYRAPETVVNAVLT